jgi:S-(hydroxymethyl)glutathione dehydrogenase/alcohol dehydrogenase
VAVGATRPVSQAIDALSPAGPACSSASPSRAPPSRSTCGPLVTGERVVRGSSYGSARTREDLPRLVNLYLAGKLRIDELINRALRARGGQRGFRALAAGELARGLIVF